MASIPNIRQIYGRLYRTRLDPAADSWADPWMHTIRTRSGCVYVHGEEFAGVEVKRSCWQLATRLREAGYRLHQDGDDVRVYLVPWTDLPTVLPWLQPYKRRQDVLTDEQRQARSAQMKAINASRRARAQMPPDERPATPEAEVGGKGV